MGKDHHHADAQSFLYGSAKRDIVLSKGGQLCESTSDGHFQQ